MRRRAKCTHYHECPFCHSSKNITTEASDEVDDDGQGDWLLTHECPDGTVISVYLHGTEEDLRRKWNSSTTKVQIAAAMSPREVRRAANYRGGALA